MSSRPGLIVVMTAPSGTGKTTLAERVFKQEPTLAFSVSHTTRPPRDGEVNGEDYHFVSESEFDALIAQDAFAEWAHVHKRRYGTSKAEIARIQEEGNDVLLDVDVQGAHELLKTYPDALSIFVLPPSMKELEKRLKGRGTDSTDQVDVRLRTARSEILEAQYFRYVIVNDELSEAAEQFRAVLRAERQRFVSQKGTWDALVAEINQSKDEVE